KTHLTPDRVGEDDFAIFWNSKANGRPLACRDSSSHFLGCEVSASARIARRSSRRERFLTFRLELLTGTETVIGMIAGEQFLRVRAVQMQPLGLPIRAARSADIGTLVPIESEPR